MKAEELNKLRDQFKAEIAMQDGSCDYRVLVGMDTGGQAAGAVPVYEAMVEDTKKNGYKCKVIAAGAIGVSSLEPIVEVVAKDGTKTTYVHVNPDKAHEIMAGHIGQGKIVMDYVVGTTPLGKMGREANDPVVTNIEDTEFFKRQKRVVLHNCGKIDPCDINEYIGADGYQALAKALSSMKPRDVTAEVLKSGLRGRGGAGFPTGRKWGFINPDEDKDHYVICNFDEGDPGAFMNRAEIEGDPHGVIEGMALAGYAIGAKQGYIYVRAEYPLAIERLNNAIAQARKDGLLGEHIMGTDFTFDLELRLGAGAFVCGEETALIQSVEGKRGMPNPRPPFPAISGVWGKPTVVDNVETLFNIPLIIHNGADWFLGIGDEKSHGTKVFCLAGKTNNPGLVEIPLGTTLREVVYDIGGGCQAGKKFKAVQTGGPSGGCLTERDLDTPITYDTLVAAGSMMGSGGMIILDEDNCMVDVARFYMDFICDESCGKCTPCRVGTKRMLEMLTSITEGRGTQKTIDDLKYLAAEIKDSALCALGQTSANPILSTLNKFPEEYQAHIEKTCPSHVCKKLLKYEIDREKCIGCGACERNCPVKCIAPTDYVAPGKKLPARAIDQYKCIKCGTCMATCRFGAISRH